MDKAAKENKKTVWDIDEVKARDEITIVKKRVNNKRLLQGEWTFFEFHKTSSVLCSSFREDYNWANLPLFGQLYSLANNIKHSVSFIFVLSIEEDSLVHFREEAYNWEVLY